MAIKIKVKLILELRAAQIANVNQKVDHCAN